MIGSEHENELALDNVAGIRERTQSGAGRRAKENRRPSVGQTAATLRVPETRAEQQTFGRADGGDPSGGLLKIGPC